MRDAKLMRNKFIEKKGSSAQHEGGGEGRGEERKGGGARLRVTQRWGGEHGVQRRHKRGNRLERSIPAPGCQRVERARKAVQQRGLLERAWARPVTRSKRP